MALCGCFIDRRAPLLPPTLIFLYACGLGVSVVNTIIYFQHRRSVYPGALINAHLAFCIIGCLVFLCVSSVMWLRSYKYSHTHAECIWLLCVGLWLMLFCKDLPLMIIETHAFVQVGWQNGTFGDASFILQTMFFVPSALVSWTTISWYLAGFLERQFGNVMKVALQENMYGRFLDPAAPMQLTAVPKYPPPLPIQEMHYTIAHSPHITSLAEYPLWVPSSARHESTTAFEQSHETATEHPRGTIIRDFENGSPSISMDNLRALSRKDDPRRYPAVI
ncbi:hypothetical protein JKF63_00936 [Porcisia hertigi]|uniref:Uncharacterized protein n=1 Tax=Porcisia hertigi TaxID=2761500 RepID=A0A836HDZ3_9TRYP|nr:hypothetical protein JKF63_00936 [Porcisia hertigi]